jgi:hypothetical protein
MDKSDSGGVGAIKGFLYQDFVAAYLVIGMLNDKSIKKVRFEVSDDVDVVYEDFIRYVQVKSTSSDSNWTLDEFAKVSVKETVGPRKGVKKIKAKDSILHKSLECDKETLPGKFSIITPRDVAAGLAYLKISIANREDTASREQILKALKRKINDFKSSNGNDVEYWLDNSCWEVMPAGKYLEAIIYKEILISASECFGVVLDPTRDPIRILNDVLVSIIKKSAKSRVLYTEDGKSYKREDLILWFKEELEHYSKSSESYVKVYKTSGPELIPILSSFIKKDDIYSLKGAKALNGVEGSYYRNAYQYEKKSKLMKQWLPEVLLRASEISDTSPEKFEEKIKIYQTRQLGFLNNLEELISTILLHSLIRTSYSSQPIPAQLFIDDGSATNFDNIHIVLQIDKPDQLVMGFSNIVRKNISDSIRDIVNEFDKLLGSEAFTSTSEKILEVKENGYLLKHDIDEILNKGVTLDDNLNRFVFAFFIGYESNNVSCSKLDMEENYRELLEVEVLSSFRYLVDSLILKDKFFEDLNIIVFLYPIPSVDKFEVAMQSEMEV